MNLKDHFINTVAGELEHLNGTEFENMCCPLIEIITDREFELKGHNLELKPVRGSVDLIMDDDTRIIGQCGTDKDYFSGNKALNDIDGSLKNSPHFHTIYLFSNRRATGAELQSLDNAVKAKLNSIKRLNTAYQYHIYDSQRIAKAIYENIYKTVKVKEILSILPKSYEYYQCLPQTNSLPPQRPGYKHRPEEIEIGKKLMEKDFIQVYGLSGIGKTQTAIAVANNLVQEFDTVLWLDEQNFASGSLESVDVRRMGEAINLAYLLKTYRVLVIVDNCNTNIPNLKDMFTLYSQKGGKCLVTSLQCNVSNDNAYKLQPLDNEVSKAILNDCKMRPTEDQIKSIVNNVAGFPLLLELSKRSVENGDLTWDEIVGISNLTKINDDEKNVVFAQRIVGHYADRFNVMFNLLFSLDSALLSKQFLREDNELDYNALLRSAIIEDADEFCCRIHSIVLAAIKIVFETRYSESDFLKHLCRYLNNHVLLRDAGLYTFAGIHRKTLLEVIDKTAVMDSLRKVVILAYLYSVDTYQDPQPFIKLIEKVDLSPEDSDIDLRLFIERLEMELRKYRNETKDAELLEKYTSDKIKTLSELELNSSDRRALVYHHIGKWLSDIEHFDDSEKYLMMAIEQSHNSFNSYLRLARDYHKRKMPDKAVKYIKAILDCDETSQVSISVRLSAYDLISSYQYSDLRTSYIDNRKEQFAKDIYASLSESYTQTYIILAKFANHLSYNYPDFFSRLCDRLPFPMDIDNNDRVRKDYGKIILAQYRFGKYNDEYRDKLFRKAERYLLSVPRNDDYIRKDLINLYLSANLPIKAKEIAEELAKPEGKFNLQLLCKVYYANEDYLEALKCINKAIAEENTSEQEYCAAFRHDKALCLHALNEPDATDVMEEAIKLQPNDKVKRQWLDELNAWNDNPNAQA